MVKMVRFDKKVMRKINAFPDIWEVSIILKIFLI